MILYYAMGGGLGHLIRTRRVISALAITSPILLLSASEYLNRVSFPSNVSTCSVPHSLSTNSKDLQKFITKCIVDNQVESIIIDCFPCGIIGELIEFDLLNNLPLTLIARLLKNTYYQKYSDSLTFIFDSVYAVEPLTDDYTQFLLQRCTEIEVLNLSGNEVVAEVLPIDDSLLSLPFSLSTAWLVAHSGPESEVHTLLMYAAQMQEVEQSSSPIVLMSPLTPESHIPYYHLPSMNAQPCYAAAQRIITACGFNTMLETRDFRFKHRFMPFPRRYDDQLLRAERARGKGENYFYAKLK